MVGYGANKYVPFLISVVMQLHSVYLTKAHHAKATLTLSCDPLLEASMSLVICARQARLARFAEIVALQ